MASDAHELVPHGYECPECGSAKVELCFPVWVRANDIDNRELWDLDAEASPEKDSEKVWCSECQTHVVVRMPHETRPLSVPSPREQPAIRLLETRLVSLAAPRGVVLSGPAASAALLHELIGESDREEFVALLLNARHRVTHAHVVSRGALQSTTVHPREVFKAAVLANAAAVVIGHNHPSGDPQESQDDKAIATRLRDVGTLLGIELLDSIIVTPRGAYYSMIEGRVSQLTPSRKRRTLPMDPDQVLADVLEHAELVYQESAADLHTDELVAAADGLADGVIQLDSWLRRGGVLPLCGDRRTLVPQQKQRLRKRCAGSSRTSAK